VLAGLTVLAVASTNCLAAQQKVPVVLNHLRIVLDSATYHDVRNSPFILQQFSANDTVANTMFPVTGLALLGKYNFLVLGGAGASPAAEAGNVSIVLGVEQAGRLAVLGSLMNLPVDLQFGTNEFAKVPSYAGSGARVLALVPPNATSIHTEFKIQQYSELTAQRLAQTDSLPASNLGMSRFLAPFYDSRRLFSYLSGATLAVPVDDIKKISLVLQRDSITVIPEGEGAIIKLDGFTLHLVPSFVGAGVKQLQFALTRTAVGNPIYQFGQKSQLRFGPGPIAVWNFNWP
jgi:hypothetical protein